jgi:lysyl-tRNA synthetase class 1
MMHWADRIADELVAARPDTDLFTCASGISPSGQIHIGNLRDIVTIWFVGRALRERGRRVRLIHSWDDYDRFRKVPKPDEAKLKQLPAWLAERIRSLKVPESYEEHLGRPVASVPDLNGEYPSYAARFVHEFEASLAELGVEIEFLHQAELYPSGVYRDAILESVRKRREIYDILAKSKSAGPSEEERRRFVPVSVYCERCGRDSTRVELLDGSETEIRYTCSSCGNEAVLDLTAATNVKLPWRVDWAMRWRHESVVFEPFGKDHATAGGSYESSSEICREIFGCEPPVPAPYEFIGIKGLGGKMSSSAGVLLTPADLLDIYQPETILWMYARFAPMKQFDVAVDDQVLRMYDEFDRAIAGDPQVETDERALELSRIPGRELHPVPFRQLAGFAGIVQGNAEALEAIFERMGTPHRKQEFEERLKKAEAWIERYVPEQHIALRAERDLAFFESLADVEKAWVRSLHDWLASAGEVTIDEATEFVYAVPKRADDSDKEQAAAQRRFFQIVYTLLFGKTRGPRLGTFLAAVPRERFLPLLEF